MVSEDHAVSGGGGRSRNFYLSLSTQSPANGGDCALCEKNMSCDNEQKQVKLFSDNE
jgi:hypothetical protein